MEQELKNLEHKTNLIKQAIKNKNITNDMLDDYLHDFKELPNILKQKIYSIENPHLYPPVYSDEDIEVLWLTYNPNYMYNSSV